MEKETHFEGKIAQKVIVVQDEKVLLLQDPREGRDIWELPGGRMNVDEEPREAMQREFREEMGVDIDVHEVLHMKQFIPGTEGKRAFVIVYRATLTKPEEAFVVADEEVSHVGWFAKTEIASLTLYPEYKSAMEKYFVGR